MASESLQWKIDGEWLTDLARTWFWDENKPYEVVLGLLESCIQTDDKELKQNIVQSIIEGRKKFIGINNFQLVDDGENIRPLYLKIDQLTRQVAIECIREDIRVCGIKYVDPYCTVKSIRTAREKDVYTAEKCIVWFQYSDKKQINGKLLDEYANKLPAALTPTAAGLWLFEEPELIYEATEHGQIRVGEADFWKNIYEMTKDRKGFEARSNFYCAKTQVGEQEVNTFSNINDHLETDKMPECDNSLPCWSGLISPDGDFYPANFGNHESIAWHILHNGNEKSNIESLDRLIEQGWVATRFLPAEGHYVTYKGKHDVSVRWKPTKEQKDILWKLVALNQEKVDTAVVPEVFF